MKAVWDVLAVIGALTVASVAGLVAWIWRADRSERAQKRRHRDERIAQAIREHSSEGATADDLAWLGFLADQGLNGKTPKKWRRP